MIMQREEAMPPARGPERRHVGQDDASPQLGDKPATDAVDPPGARGDHGDLAPHLVGRDLGELDTGQAARLTQQGLRLQLDP